MSDKLCKQNGLSLVKPGKEIDYTGKDGQCRTRPPKEQGRSYAEYAADKAGGSFKGKLKIAIDTIIPQSKDYENFLRLMEAAKYEIKRGKYVSFRAPGQERFTRSKTLGDDYTAEHIAERIQGKKHTVSAPKQVAKTVNFLIEKNILQYADLQARVEEVASTSEQTAATLKGVESRLYDMGLLI